MILYTSPMRCGVILLLHHLKGFSHEIKMGFLQVVCLDRAELRDEPFMVFKNNHFLFGLLF